MSSIANPLDGAQQERIRRGTHKFGPDPNRGGLYSYQPDVYKHQEYPKMMLQTPRPQFKEFRKKLLQEQAGDSELQKLLLGQKLDIQSLYEAACKDWDEDAQASIVKNQEEEEQWLAEHAEAVQPVITASTKERAKEIKAQRDAQIAEHPVEKVRKV